MKRTVQVEANAPIKFIPFTDTLEDGDVRIVNRGDVNYIARLEHWTGTLKTGSYAVVVKAKAGVNSGRAGTELAWERGAYIYPNGVAGSGLKLTEQAEKLANRMIERAEQALKQAQKSAPIKGDSKRSVKMTEGVAVVSGDARSVKVGVSEDGFSADMGHAIERTVKELRV